MTIEVEPFWYLYSMHFTAILTTPINFFGVFVILFCQKNRLSSLRWHFLVFQICSMTTDFFINIGTLPVIYSPFPIGRPHGLFTKLFQLFGFETSTEAQCIMVFVSIYMTAGSVELLFFLRYQAILPSVHPHKLSAVISVMMVLIYQIILIAIMIVSFRIAVPNQSSARIQFATLYPELQYLVVDEHVYIVSVVVELAQIIFLTSCFIRLGIGLLTVILLIWMSHGALHRFDLSVKTRSIHLQLIKSLCYQISIPIIAFYVPILIVILPLMFTIPNSQLSFFISLLCMSIHTALGTISMIYFNRDYRYWLLSTIRSKLFKTLTPISKDFLTKDNRNLNASKIASAMF